MKKARFIVIIVSVILIVIGIVLGITAFCAAGFNFSEMSRDNREKCTVSMNDWLNDIVGDKKDVEIESLDLNTIDDDIKILKTDKDEAYVEYYDGNDFGYEFFLEGSAIKSLQTDKRPWYEHFFNFGTFSQGRSFVVYLPENDHFGKISRFEINSVSGDIILEKDAPNFMEYSLNTVSGDVGLSFDHVLRSVDINTVSGNVKLDRCNTYSFSAKTVSGEMSLTDTVVIDSAKLDTVSGDISLERYDCSLTDVNSISGDVKGTVLEGVYGKISSTSGESDIPSYYDAKEEKTESREKYEDFIYPQGEREFNAETVSGDVILTLAE